MRIAIVVTLLACGSPAAAAALQTPPPPQVRSNMDMRSELDQGQIDRAMRNRSRDEAQTQSRLAAQQPAERQERAARLATLANSGHCAEAIQTARDEGDGEMAVRLRDFCRANASD